MEMQTHIKLFRIKLVSSDEYKTTFCILSSLIVERILKDTFVLVFKQF